MRRSIQQSLHYKRAPNICREWKKAFREISRDKINCFSPIDPLIEIDVQ